MIARVLTTFAIFLLALNAFWIGALGGGHVLNPSGIAFLLLAAFVWFGWGTIAAAFRSVMEESNVPIIRLGASIIEGMRRSPRPRRESGEGA